MTNTNLIDKKRQTSNSKTKWFFIGRLVLGIISTVLFILTLTLQITKLDILHISGIKWLNSNNLQLLTIIEIAIALLCFIPAKKIKNPIYATTYGNQKLNKRTLFSALFILIAIPLTILTGLYWFDDKKYYFISILVILETAIPFITAFESRKQNARELIIISVICAIAVSSRMAFSMFPQFKPVIALVIISGVCFGGEAGFLVGAITAFVSNFFFGQGPWTPWQTFSFGIIGFISGILFTKGLLKRTKLSLSLFGFFATIVIYGGITNPSSVLMWQDNPTVEMIISSYVMGFPFDLVHAVSTAFFLWFISEPMTEILNRIITKYGLIKN